MNNRTVISVIVFVIIIITAIWVQKQMNQLEEPAPAPPIAVAPPPVEHKKIPQGDVVRFTRVQHGAEFVESNFFIGDQLICNQKFYADGHVDQTGEIPDGWVKFTDEIDQTHGEEYYHNNKKDGEVKTYYDNGQLKSDAYYSNGVLTKNKEFYTNGKVRFEVDYSDAIFSEDKNEVGIGKLYFLNGYLKYEWNLTRSNKGGYKRSYNQDGTLRAESQFDEYGRFIREVKVQPPQETPPKTE